MKPRELLEELIPVARNAGALIMDIYASDFEVRDKGDTSPVTAADERAEVLILESLARLTPDIPVIAEEAVAAGEIPDVADRFWLVDPLDGTREFINRNGEFTVNIALIENHQPVLGVVYAPAIERLFAGAINHAAFVEDANGERHDIHVRQPPEAGLTVVASRSHSDPEQLQAFLKGQRVAEVRNAGSSLKLCLVAAGEADLYPRLGRTMEWDIAAGHAVLAAAGGHLTDTDMQPMPYGKSDFANPHFIAWGFTQ